MWCVPCWFKCPHADNVIKCCCQEEPWQHHHQQLWYCCTVAVTPDSSTQWSCGFAGIINKQWSNKKKHVWKHGCQAQPVNQAPHCSDLPQFVAALEQPFWRHEPLVSQGLCCWACATMKGWRWSPPELRKVHIIFYLQVLGSTNAWMKISSTKPSVAGAVWNFAKLIKYVAFCCCYWGH